MAKFDLVYRQLGNLPAGWLPTLPLRVPLPGGGSQELAELFHAASGGCIQMTEDADGMGVEKGAALDAVGAVDMHELLAEMTGNAPGVVPVGRLGVIYAPYYRPRPHLYGLMFDRGITPAGSEIVADVHHRLPREGCAVFLGPMQRLVVRSDYEAQVACTTVHELGHVFNLAHFEPPPDSFMNTSRLEAPLPVKFNFTLNQQAHLARVDMDPFVAPGGEPFLAEGMLPHGDDPTRVREVPASQLQLTAVIEPAEFWPWEPVELDLTLTMGKRAGRVPAIPDQIDPGYGSFEIWIEEPTGERRRYCPPRRYGAAPVPLVWEDRSLPWRRDISIFSEAGGYTFRRAGRHQVWVRFRISRGRELVSRPCEVYVRPLRLHDRAALGRLLGKERLLRTAQHSFYYRSGRLRRREMEALHTLGAQKGDAHVRASALYALGRIGLAGQRMKQHTALQKGAWECLRKAAEAEGLSDNRRKNARDLLSRAPKAARKTTARGNATARRPVPVPKPAPVPKQLPDAGPARKKRGGK